jgi:glycosyltransferase involved in cell wall biosynthesis
MATQEKSNRVAIVTEFLYVIRGNEKLLNALLERFPGADIFVLLGSKKTLSLLPTYNGQKITFSFLNKLPFVSKYYRYTYPLWPIAIEQFDLRSYDTVISLSSSVAKGVVIPEGTYHISYINSPMRYAWDLKELYFKKYPKILRFLIDICLHYLRIWDVSRNNQIDYMIANSQFIKNRIEKYYGRSVDKVIYPFSEKVEISNNLDRKEYYLYHGALEPNKGVLEVVRSAIKYGFPLIVSGSGSQLLAVKKLAKGFKNIKILGWVTDEEKYQLFSEAQAFLFPSVEDFGIVALESLSIGTPVLALKHSGTAEIINNTNGVLIESQNIDQIYEGITKLKSMEFKRKNIMNSVEGFSKEKFLNEIEKVVRRTPF